jgi:hypothetical protein
MKVQPKFESFIRSIDGWGFAVWLFAAVWSARIVYESTLLSWREGPQMIGFSWGHTIGIPFIFCWLWSHVILAWFVVRILFGRAKAEAGRMRPVLGAGAFLLVVAPVWIPSGWYLRWTFAVFGPGVNVEDHLKMAAAYGDLDLVKYLVPRYVTVNGDGILGTSVLDGASVDGRTPVVYYLLAQGADPNRSCGSTGTTPLIHAIECNHPSTVKALIDGGADPRLKDVRGLTALEAARAKANGEILEILSATEEKR